MIFARSEGHWDIRPFACRSSCSRTTRADETKADTPISFETEGIEAALARARAAAGERDVLVAGGAEVAQQALVDELVLHVAPVLLGGGTPLFAAGQQVGLECTRAIDSPAVTHLRYRVRRNESAA